VYEIYGDYAELSEQRIFFAKKNVLRMWNLPCITHLDLIIIKPISLFNHVNHVCLESYFN